MGDRVSESYSSIQTVGIQLVSLSDDEGHQRLLVVDEEDRFTKSGNSNFFKRYLLLQISFWKNFNLFK